MRQVIFCVNVATDVQDLRNRFPQSTISAANSLYTSTHDSFFALMVKLIMGSPEEIILFSSNLIVIRSSVSVSISGHRLLVR